MRYFPCSFTCNRQERSLRNEKAIQLGGVEMVPSIQSGARFRLSFYPSLILKTRFLKHLSVPVTTILSPATLYHFLLCFADTLRFFFFSTCTQCPLAGYLLVGAKIR